MTREEYLSFRNSNQLPITLAFEYYQYRSGDTMSLEQFSKFFLQFAELYKPDFQELYHYYDVKFEVVAIIDTLKTGYPVIFV